MNPSVPKPPWTLEELLAAALQLPKEERLRIAKRLLESAEDERRPGDLDPAWRDEIASRLDKLDRDEAVLHDHDDVMRDALARPGRIATTGTWRSNGTPLPLPSRGQGMDAERYARGEFLIADNFAAPLPAEIQRYFDGEDDEEA